MINEKDEASLGHFSHLRKHLLAQYAPYLEKHPEIRHYCTGRSTVIALQTIARALSNPGARVAIIDHHGTIESNKCLARMVQDLIERLEFEGFYIRLVDLSLTFELPFPFEQKDKAS